MANFGVSCTREQFILNNSSLSGVMFIWISFVLIYGVTGMNDYENFAVTSLGASCLSGDYTNIDDVNCTNVIDRDIMTSYIPEIGRGWLTINMDTVAMVTAVDITLDKTISADFPRNTRLRVIFSDSRNYTVLIRTPASASVTYQRQRVIFRIPHVTHSVTLAWENIAAIADIAIMGSDRGLRHLNMTSLSLSMGSGSASAHDADLRSSCHLLRGDQMQIELVGTTGARLGILALYSAPLLPRATDVPLVINVLDEWKHTLAIYNISYSNQGSNRPIMWQTVTMDTISSAISLYVSRDVATISELEVYTLDVENPSMPVSTYDVPHSLKSTAAYVITDMAAIIIGDTYTEPPTSDYVTDASRTLAESYTTTFDNSTKTSLESHVVYTTHTIQDVSTVNIATNSSLSDYGNTTVVPETFSFDFWNLSWYWYVLIGTGAFILVLVIIIIILLTRLKTKTYNPNTRPPRPRVVLRSMSSVGDTGDVAMVTPTRGYYHLTMNSQSSMPLPYTAFSAVNTSTFGRKEAQQYSGFYVEEVDGPPYGHGEFRIHDGELSDDCFM